jgi:hypothetical protein
MKRIAIVAVLVAGVIGAPAVFAADSGGGATGPYAQARNVDSQLGALYGPVRAGDSSSTSYGYFSK